MVDFPIPVMKSELICECHELGLLRSYLRFISGFQDVKHILTTQMVGDEMCAVISHL